ncbi:MAG: TlpA family protein disulfide reductase [Nitrospiraceae bacterium]|nr:TlpA family protein disulfide reductase [Nitrospiraceae bacterium]
MACHAALAALIIFFLSVSFISCTKDEIEFVPSVGEKALDFKYSDIHGNKISLFDYKGKVVLIEFWATWCPPCKTITPFLNMLHNKYKDKGLVVLAITPETNIENIKRYIIDNNVLYMVVPADQNIIKRYGIIGIPAFYVIDKDGKVANKITGAVPGLNNELISSIETLL